MVKVEIQYQKGDFASMKVKGHADSGPYGQDIVCAAVSAICFGALNALENADEDFDIIIDEDNKGNLGIAAKHAPSEHDATVLETWIIQLKTIEVSYSDRLTIKERK